MIKQLYILVLLTGFNYMFAQNCSQQLVSDSLYKPTEKQSYLVNVINCPLKNGGQIQFINNNGKFVLKITPNSSSILTEEKLFERNKKQCSFLQDGKTIYFSKLGEGICAIDTLTGKVTRYNTKNGLSSNDVNTIFKASHRRIKKKKYS